MNILLITADQWRGDCLSALGHDVRTPAVDALAAEGTLFARHYAPCAPCSPARASLYTGLYQMTHRVVWNGVGLDARFDNVAKAARRAGYRPTLFGYTDTAPDPRTTDPADPDLTTYETVLPGFAVERLLDEAERPWISWLGARGHDVSDPDRLHVVPPEPGQRVSRRPPVYGAEETQTAFLTDAFLRWEAEQAGPWCAHVSYLRPHPPFVVPEPYASMYPEDAGPAFTRHGSAAEESAQHPVIAALQDLQRIDSFLPGVPGLVRDLSDRDFARIRALYLGLISEVDAQLRRLFDTLRRRGAWEDTLVVFTSDHGEMMGDHRMLGKGGLYPQSYHIPLVVKIPGGATGQRVEAFTSAADVFPTLAELMGSAPRNALDGRSLTPFLTGGRPRTWRQAALWESDLRHVLEAPPPGHAPRDCVLQCRMDAEHLYVSSPGWGPALFDLAEDPGCLQNRAADPALRDARLAAAEALLADRAQAMDDTLARACVWNWHARH